MLGTLEPVTSPLFYFEGSPVYEDPATLPPGGRNERCWVWDGEMHPYQWDESWEPVEDGADILSKPEYDEPEIDDNAEHGSNVGEEMDKA